MTQVQCCIQPYKQQFTNRKMFSQTCKNLGMMLKKNDDVEGSKSKIYVKYFLKNGDVKQNIYASLST